VLAVAAAGGMVDDHGERRVLQPRFTRQSRLGHTGHADQFAAVEDRPTLHPEAQRVLMRKPAKTPLDELTPRERSVLELLAEGRSNRQIANRLGLTEGTVKGYLTTIFAKLGVVDRTQAALLAAQHGLGRKG